MAKARPVLIEDITRYRIPSGLRFGPSGSVLAFQVTEPDLKENTSHTSIWLVRNGRAERATWSLDASIVDWLDEDRLILSRRTGKEKEGLTELFLLSLQGGEAAPWMTLPFPLTSFKKISEGLFAVTGMIEEKDPDAYRDTEEARKAKLEARKKEEDCRVLDEVPYWINGAGFLNGKRNALFTVSLSGPGTEPVLKRITAPSFNTDEMTADGDVIYYTGSEIRGKRSLSFNKVYAYDTKARKRRSLYTKKGMSFSSLFVLDGILYGGASDLKAYGCNQTRDICRIGKNDLEVVYTPSVSLHSSVIGDTTEGGPASRALEGEYLTLATIEGHNAVFGFARGNDGLTQRTIWEEEGMVTDMDACSDQIALVYQDWNHVAEVYVMDRDGKGLTRVSCLNDDMLEGRYIARPDRLDYRSGTDELRGWVLLPEDYREDRKYPAILDIHGGPRCAYGETFFHEMQVWAARGYIVFFTNIRGSDGRGDAFADIRNQLGYADFQNLMDFTDAVLAAYPAIDPDRVCVTGGSYGGFMTNWIIGHTDRFCCAASQRSISNWISFSFISDIGELFGPDQCGAEGLFGQENTAILWKHSPLRCADRVKTPTLFIHSDEDYRCPLAEGMQMMQALAARKVPVRMCLFRGENHELSRSGRPANRIRRLEEMTGWFDRYAKA